MWEVAIEIAWHSPPTAYGVHSLSRSLRPEAAIKDVPTGSREAEGQERTFTMTARSRRDDFMLAVSERTLLPVTGDRPWVP